MTTTCTPRPAGRRRGLHATDGWYATPAGIVVGPPPAWKTWLVSTPVIWALLTAVSMMAEPVLGRLDPPLRLGLTVPLVGALMTWIVMPALSRLLGDWLHGAVPVSPTTGVAHLDPAVRLDP